MAGKGPAPAEQRRRRNEPARGEWVDLPPVDTPVLPALPDLTGRARRTWDAWRRDPATTQYTSAEISYAIDTIELYAVMKPSTANEVRLRMDGLGLTPKGKRDLRWRVSDSTDTAQQPGGGRRGSSERRRRLSVVA